MKTKKIIKRYNKGVKEGLADLELKHHPLNELGIITLILESKIPKDVRLKPKDRVTIIKYLKKRKKILIKDIHKF